MKKIKVHSLTGRITSRLMRQAFQAVKRNHGAAGVDKISIQMFAANLAGDFLIIFTYSYVLCIQRPWGRLGGRLEYLQGYESIAGFHEGFRCLPLAKTIND